MASQISPALGGSAGHFEALQHFAFGGEARFRCSFCINLKGLFLGLPGGPKFRSIFSAI